MVMTPGQIGTMLPTQGVGVSEDVRQKMRVDALTRGLNAGATEEKKLREACQGFEAVFINKLLKQMRDTVQKSDFLHSPYEDQYVSMFDQELADKLSKDGGIGLGDMLYQQLKQKIAVKKGQDAKTDRSANPAENLAPPPGLGAVLPPNRPVLGRGLAMERLPLDKAETFKARERISYEALRPGAFRSDSGDAATAQAPAATASLPENDAARSAILAPVNGEITSEYGWRDDPFTGKKAWHAGLDIAAEAGSPVSACWDGKVVFAGERAGYGKAVVIEHPGGWQSLYGHNGRITANVGDLVSAGQKIAEVGSTGRSTGPHVHFELVRNGRDVDPENVGKRLLAAAGPSPGA